MTWLRSPRHFPLAVLFVVAGFAQPPRAAAQDKDPLAQPAQVVQPPPPTSAPASQADKPGQPQASQPTVVLKPGEVPGIAFKEPSYDFGRVRAGTSVTHEFVFTNTGTGPLEILQVKPGCGCTVAGQYDRIIQPGQSGKVPLKMTTGHGGRMSKTVTVHTNAPAPQATVTLTMQGDVWDAVAYEPRLVNFGRLTADAARAEGLAQRVTITNNMEAPADLTEVRSTSPLFHAEAKMLEPGKKFELVVTVVTPLKSGNNAGSIELATGVPEAPKLSIPISAFVMPDVEVSPDSVMLPVYRAASTTRQVTVRNNTQAPLKISDLLVSNPALKVTLQETHPGMLYTITLEAPAGSQVSAGDKITFSTDCPTVPNVLVPVSEMRVRAALSGQPASATSKPAALPPSQPANGQPAVKSEP